MTASETFGSTDTESQPQYFRPTNLETGEPTLLAFFTAELFDLLSASEHDIDERTEALADDVRDEMSNRGIPIRPTIKPGRIQILQETDPDEHNVNRVPMVVCTVMAFFTDAEPDDPRLAELEAGFHGERVDGKVSFKVPTVAEEEAEVARERREQEDLRQYRARTDENKKAEQDKAARLSDDPFADDSEDPFD